MHKILDEKAEIVKVINSNINKIPFIISIPHSGLYLTSEMNEKLRKDSILANMDWYIPELYSFLEELGFTVIINNVSRYVIDPNRNIENNDFNEYSKSLIYTKTTFNKEIYDKTLSQEEIDERIKNIYILYHKILKQEILKKLKFFNKIYIIDLHSFGKIIGSDIVLGNDNGRTMREEVFSNITNLFTDNGFRVAVNNPYKGGYITKHYGDKNKQCESLQIEISYQSYIDKRVFDEEEYPTINNNVMNTCQKKLRKIFCNISKIS